MHAQAHTHLCNLVSVCVFRKKMFSHWEKTFDPLLFKEKKNQNANRYSD